jgi:uncharacterized delta-60 repeat protein
MYADINKRLFVRFMIFIVLMVVGKSQSQSVQLDATFGNKGIVTTAINLSKSYSEANTVKILSNGKIVAGGFYSNENNYYNFAITRYNTDGSLDNSFGTNGVATIPGSSSNSEVSSIVIQTDSADGNKEKIIAAGFTWIPNDTDFVLVRFNPDGSIDSTFGGNGNGIVTSGINNFADYATSAALQRDGKIIIAGYQSNGHDLDFMLARFSADGIPDNNFGGGDGIVTTDVSGHRTNDRSYSVAIQNDGNIIIAGSSDEENSFAAARYKSDGSPDASFGSNGIALTSVGSDTGRNNIGYSITIQNDGRIIIGGRSKNDNVVHITLLRYKSNGISDSTFDNDGIVVTDLRNNADVRSVFPYHADGENEKILAAGTFFNGDDLDIVLTRYNADGSPDAAFGTGGVLIIPRAKSNQTAFAADYQIDPVNGRVRKIITAGYSFDGDNIDFALASLNGDGIIDRSFGTDGIVNSPIENTHSVLNEIAIQQGENNEEKIVAAGRTGRGDSSYITVVRYNSDGNPDSTFGTAGDGIVLTRVSESESIISLNIQKDGKIVAVSNSTLIRYTRDGIIDSSFGLNGIVQLPISAADETNHSAAIQDDGKIVIAGSFDNGSDFDYAVVRYDTSGNSDTDFGVRGDGIVVTPIGASNDFANSLAIQDDGKIVVAGDYRESSDKLNIALVRYDPNGAPDNTFGVNGIVKRSIGSVNDFVFSTVIQDDGKIIAAGSSAIFNDYDFTLVRFNANGSIDSTFGINGIVTTPIGDEDDIVVSAVLQTAGGSDSKIVAAGNTFVGVNENFALVRYNLDGSRDNTFGTNGIITGHTGSSNFAASSVLIQKDGKIVLGGTSSSMYADFTVFNLIRYNADIATQVDGGSSGNAVNEFKLGQSYPNPFNSQTRINYIVPSRDNSGRGVLLVQLKVYNVLGEEVATLVNKEQQPGKYEISFDAGRLPSGVYFYRIKAGSFVQTKKMILLK